MTSFENFPLLHEENTVANKRFAEQSLEELALFLSERTYKDYPIFEDRLRTPTLELTLDGKPNLRLGSWDAGQMLPHPDELADIRRKNLPTDQWGRPVHPWLEQMITDPRLGVVTGKGDYWKWGPNYTADAIVIKNGHILLIERGDTSQLAFPGGFIDEADLSDTRAGVREAKEEADIDLDDFSQSAIIYQGLVADPRITAHAWPVTTAITFIDQGSTTLLPNVRGKDDARAAFWIPIDEARQLRLFGSHGPLRDLALAKLNLA